MRVLITADPMLPVPPMLYGGIERIVASLVEHLVARGAEVGLIARHESSCSATANFAWPAEPARALAHMHILRRASRSFEPQVIHSFSRLAHLLPLLPKQWLPKVMSYQREPTIRTVRWANRLARGSLTFTGCSGSICGKGRSAGGTWHTIHNFVDLERYTFQSRVEPNAPLIFLSRIEPIKGAHLAIEACRRAGRRLIIAGNHSEKDDEEGCYWREIIKPQLDGAQIEYVGPIDDGQKNELLGGAAALIVPVQWDEPFGIVFIEAFACGTPVISCPRGALPEIVDHGCNGFLATDLDQLSQYVNQVGQLSRQLSRTAAIERFSAQAIVPSYELLYRQLSSSVTSR